MPNLTESKKVTQQIADAIHPQAIILFKSHARGQQNLHSDVDLLVSAESDLPRFKRSREIYRLFKPYPFGMDILVLHSRGSPKASSSTAVLDRHRPQRRPDPLRKTILN